MSWIEVVRWRQQCELVEMEVNVTQNFFDRRDSHESGRCITATSHIGVSKPG